MGMVRNAWSAFDLRNSFEARERKGEGAATTGANPEQAFTSQHGGDGDFLGVDCLLSEIFPYNKNKQLQ